MIETQHIRNVAVIAHVDHGKTTLIDALLKQTHVFRSNQDEMSQERILDSNEIERERGITILAKNCAIRYLDTKINIIDTPGHADFSGEVERTLSMADGALLIIDAQEGPMPQTRFVLKKALELNLKIIVVINKIDKQFARVEYVINKLTDLFLELATTEVQLDFPVLYAIARQGKVFATLPADFHQAADVFPLLETIVKEIPAPIERSEAPFKMVVSTLDYNPHIGRIVIGKIFQGQLHKNDPLVVAEDLAKKFRVESLMLSDGLGRVKVEEAVCGDIVAFTGIQDIQIGQTICDSADTEPISTIAVGEPTLHIIMGANTSPMSGKEGDFTTSRQIEERLMKELESNLSLRVEKQESGKFKVSGRGELHLSILLETMRREGFEMEVSKPEVIIKEVDGQKQEPVEEVSIIVPQEYMGVINQELGKRFGQLQSQEQISENEIEFIYHISTRAIIGLRSLLLTMTKGTVVFNSQLFGFEPVGRDLPQMRKGVLIASQQGEALSYGLNAAQERGITFVEPGTHVYEGMIVGQNSKGDDMEVNICKGKQLTNMRTHSSDGIIRLVPALNMSLEQSLDFLEDDELLEITPLSLRLRKKFLTDIERRRQKNPRTR